MKKLSITVQLYIYPASKVCCDCDNHIKLKNDTDDTGHVTICRINSPNNTGNTCRNKVLLPIREIRREKIDEIEKRNEF